MISLIAAIGKNNGIGKDLKLPWKLPLDLVYFKKITNNHIVIMGRKTFESIGKPLRGRSNWILTRDHNYKVNGCKMFYSIDEVIKELKDKTAFVIGGEQIFNEFFPYAKKLFITFIDESFNVDTYFPKIKDNEWQLISKIKGEKNEKNLYDYYFLVYDKILF